MDSAGAVTFRQGVRLDARVGDARPKLSFISCLSVVWLGDRRFAFRCGEVKGSGYRYRSDASAPARNLRQGEKIRRDFFA
jgi:hypothetical protein